MDDFNQVRSDLLFGEFMVTNQGSFKLAVTNRIIQLIILQGGPTKNNPHATFE